tara:strand:- start:707 stop:1114 length:408 start_codon:yes stop_codon:yes gene_type:complete
MKDCYTVHDVVAMLKAVTYMMEQAELDGLVEPSFYSVEIAASYSKKRGQCLVTMEPDKFIQQFAGKEVTLTLYDVDGAYSFADGMSCQPVVASVRSHSGIVISSTISNGRYNSPRMKGRGTKTRWVIPAKQEGSS